MSLGNLKNLVFGTGGRYGRLSRSLSFALTSYSYNNGIRSFDTGLSYSKGRSQSLLFSNLIDLHIDRSCYSISTKISPKLLVELDDIQLRHLLFSGFEANIAYIDCLMLWGPTACELDNKKIMTRLASLKSSGLICRIGINTHESAVMAKVNAGSFEIFDDIMVDFNLLQQDRLQYINDFVSLRRNRNVWAGTVYCQGFLLHSLLSIYLRSRSISYLLRALLQKSTRRYMFCASSVRNSMRHRFGPVAPYVPLSYVLSQPSVTHVPIGMLSHSSIDRNLSIYRAPVQFDDVEFFAATIDKSRLLSDVC
jgi:aryl-alcohol dehydrogenase-like predicted oxidoreductase